MSTVPPAPADPGPFSDDTPLANLIDPDAGQTGDRATRFIKNLSERIERAKSPEGKVDPPPLPKVGDRIGKYDLISELGRGFSSIVFRAHHRMLGIDVALKILLRTDQDSEMLSGSYREANLLAQLNHPNITRVLDFDEHGDWHFLVLEYVNGSDVRALIQRAGRVEQLLLVGLIQQTCEGLRYAHQLGVIHCDIKPANLLLTDDGKLKVADLGLAKISGQGQVQTKYKSGTTGAGGTPLYIAPEMATGGFDSADHRSDIYSLGVSMYHALTGSPPFMHENPYELVRMHILDPVPALALRCPGLDFSLVALVTCMLAKNPKDRPQSYDEILADLRIISESISTASDDDSSVQLFFRPDGTIAPEDHRTTRFWDKLFKRS